MKHITATKDLQLGKYYLTESLCNKEFLSLCYYLDDPRASMAYYSFKIWSTSSYTGIQDRENSDEMLLWITNHNVYEIDEGKAKCLIHLWTGL